MVLGHLHGAGDWLVRGLQGHLQPRLGHGEVYVEQDSQQFDRPANILEIIKHYSNQNFLPPILCLSREIIQFPECCVADLDCC